MAVEVPRKLAAATDRRLLELVHEGNDAAFAEIVARYGGDIHRTCRRILGRDLAEDAVQQSLLRCLRAIRAGTAPRELGPWLQAIARNTALSQLSSAREPLLPLDPEAQDARCNHTMEDRAELHALLGMLADLPDRQRIGLVRSAEGFSNSVIAAELGLSEPATRQLLHRARQSLRRSMPVFMPPPVFWLSRRLDTLAGRAGSAAGRAGAFVSRLPASSATLEPILPRAAVVAAAAAAVATPIAALHIAQRAPGLRGVASQTSPRPAGLNPVLQPASLANPLFEGSVAWAGEGTAPDAPPGPTSPSSLYATDPTGVGSYAAGGDVYGHPSASPGAPAGDGSLNPQATIASARDSRPTSDGAATPGDAPAGTSEDSGTSGTSGTSGSDPGASGSSGAASGTSGDSANSSTGNSGASGDSGAAGTSGTSGDSTPADSSGNSGSSATSGSSPTSGSSGASGSSATSGASGSSGTSGSSATSGASGSSGTSGST